MIKSLVKNLHIMNQSFEGANGTWRMAYVAQGTKDGEERSFKRLYTVEIAPPKP